MFWRDDGPVLVSVPDPLYSFIDLVSYLCIYFRQYLLMSYREFAQIVYLPDLQFAVKFDKKIRASHGINEREVWN